MEYWFGFFGFVLPPQLEKLFENRGLFLLHSLPFFQSSRRALGTVTQKSFVELQKNNIAKKLLQEVQIVKIKKYKLFIPPSNSIPPR